MQVKMHENEITHKHLNRSDFLCIGVTAFLMFLLIYWTSGFMKSGIDAPLTYVGGDDFTAAAKFKSLRQNGWTETNPFLGAPFEQNSTSIPSTYLCNFDRAIEMIISRFFDNPFAALNFFYVLIIPMCYISAYAVLREIGINRIISIFGAVLFSWTPYVFFRSEHHLALTSCYFIPFSILLCIWTLDGNDEFLVFNKDFIRKKKNWIAVIMCFLIANNGLGYYPIFTCFFLLITAVYIFAREKSIKVIIKPAILIGLIASLFILNEFPFIINKIFSGDSLGGVSRTLADGELYGLKIVQLFLPLNGHGIFNDVISDYNSQMPLVNENRGAYLGLGGVIGFVISLLLLFKRNEDQDRKKILSLLALLNVWAVLYGSIGGFSSIINILGFRFLRGSNRISIFISFISITTLCISLQRMNQYISKNLKGKRKIIVKTAMIAFALICIYDVSPVHGANDNTLKVNTENYAIDNSFVLDIESQMAEGDMIYQMPYHKYPEAGSDNNMEDYQLLTGFLHSYKLKWSYGAVKGSTEDKWHEFVSNLPMNMRLETIIRAGFKGIYIDTRAFTVDELDKLCKQIENIIEENPTVSENNCLLFYNLNHYISAHPEIFNEPPITTEDILNCKVLNQENLPVVGESSRSVDRDCLILDQGSIQYGPYTFLDVGKYAVSIHGNNLLNAGFDVSLNTGTEQLELYNIKVENELITYEFDVFEELQGVEFRLLNNSDEPIELFYYEVKRIDDKS